MLKFLNIRKKYGHHLVVDIPSLEIKAGIYWLSGANGSGKSTVLKMAGGLIPFDGEIAIGSINLKKQSTEYRRLVSYAEAEPLFPDYVSGLDLVDFYNSVRKADKKFSNQLIEQIGIDTFYKNPIGTYSSGMVKKLSLVLAFIGKSNFIFLDEPLVTLDQASVETLCNLIRDSRKEGVSFILTSHQAVEHNHFNAIELLMKDKTVWVQ
jgi:ABC-2 type transport system ATP-binding protein